MMESEDCPRLQNFIRLTFTRGRRYNTTVHAIDELGQFARFLGCDRIGELEHALLPYLIDEKRRGKPYRDVDTRAYQLLSDFNAYLSDQGL
ncbi:MAG TPA: hypothetical protein VLY65_02755, partial [Nitrososphaerales archaeon]|nr:hypothetical protein [Nitrososphaerales archaeon]